MARDYLFRRIFDRRLAPWQPWQAVKVPPGESPTPGSPRISEPAALYSPRRAAVSAYSVLNGVPPVEGIAIPVVMGQPGFLFQQRRAAASAYWRTNLPPLPGAQAMPTGMQLLPSRAPGPARAIRDAYRIDATHEDWFAFGLPPLPCCYHGERVDGIGQPAVRPAAAAGVAGARAGSLPAAGNRAGGTPASPARVSVDTPAPKRAPRC